MSDRTLTEKDLAHWNGIATTALLSTIGDPSRALGFPWDAMQMMVAEIRQHRASRTPAASPVDGEAAEVVKAWREEAKGPDSDWKRQRGRLFAVGDRMGSYVLYKESGLTSYPLGVVV